MRYLWFASAIGLVLLTGPPTIAAPAVQAQQRPTSGQQGVKTGRKPATTGQAAGSQQRAPSAEQPATSEAPAVPTGELSLGTVTLKRDVMADGKPLKAGTYRLRLTPQEATPPAKGQTPQLERWVEFLRGNNVAGREVVSIVPRAEVKQVAEEPAPASGAAKVQMLKGNEYLRVWVNRGGNQYLIHLPVAGGAAAKS